jgi:dihydrofolate reductase
MVAVDEKGGIGKDEKLPWHLPSDLRRFKEITMGHHLIVGRKTYESIGNPLPGRTMIIVTHQKNYISAGCFVVHSVNTALQLAADRHETEVFIIGGGEIFNQSISLADKIYLTTIHTDAGADVFFPKLHDRDWNVISSEECIQDPNDDFPSEFKELTRVY